MIVLTSAERAVYRRYADLALPRHTSYPTVPVWSTDYGAVQFRADLQQIAAPVSLYVHVPFCERLCYYCACTKEIVPRARRVLHDPADALLDGLDLEVGRFAEVMSGRHVEQVHLGGGSPTFLDCDQLARLWQIISGRFRISSQAEIAVELDPRITSYEQLQLLRSLGFNRISLGVQDFAPQVQTAVNRIQPFDTVAQTVAWCRTLGFASINFDLIYGLPYQTLATMADTLEKTISLAPDRIAFYRLAVIPEIFRWQNTFTDADLPAGELSLDLNLLAINRFLQAGYTFIGLDHFAKPNESLCAAERAGALRRNFQGMTTARQLDILGLGPSAISQLDAAFAQNARTSSEWSEAVRHDFATVRGMRLSHDDRLRRELLQQLYGYGIIEKADLESRFDIDFDGYFADEIRRLRELEKDRLVIQESDRISVTPILGRLLVRVAAAIFDHYLPQQAYREGLPAHLASRVG